MRYRRKPFPEDGETRTIHRFLLFPVGIDGDWRWFEWVWVTRVCRLQHGYPWGYRWENVRWAAGPEDDVPATRTRTAGPYVPRCKCTIHAVDEAPLMDGMPNGMVQRDCYGYNWGGDPKRGFPSYPREIGARCQVKGFFFDREHNCMGCPQYSPNLAALKVAQGIWIHEREGGK